ncbi:MAG: hypothetical protein KAS04_05765 [Candidatus Aenigmarchaeota archaeon]|nr:hypothetical protein [Candidatus Aenigmarchaeota archaeon]
MATIFYIEGPSTSSIINYLQKSSSGLKYIKLPKIGGVLSPEDVNSLSFPKMEKGDVLLWNTGHEHHASYFIGPDEPYVKSALDAHRDLYGYTGDLHAANHMTATVKNDRHLEGVEVVGVYVDAFREADIANVGLLRHFGGLNPLRFFKAGDILDPITGEVMHKTIDLDVINGCDVSPDFAIGKESLENVKSNLDYSAGGNELIRLDIGGLRPDAGEKWLRGCKELIEINLDHSIKQY